MKTLLNLLPEEEKDAIQRRLRFRFLLWQLFLLFVLQVFYLVILISTYFVLDFQLKSLQDVGGASSTAAGKNDENRLAEYEKKFQDTNAAVDVIGRIDRAHIHFSRGFGVLDPLLPQGITLYRIMTDNYRVSLTGKAVKREDLLTFDERLKNAGECITDVEIPLSNLFSQKDIDFQVDFSVAPDCLKDL